MRCILTLDVGTTSIKTCIFDKGFALLGYSVQEYELITPAKDIVELDPDLYWEALKKGVKSAVKQAGIEADRIKVITVSTQGETLIPVDSNGKALQNAIIWLDARATSESEYISGLFSEDEIYSITGLPELSSPSPISKVLWIKIHESELYERTYKFMLLEDYLIFKLTGRFVTEKSLMSSTGYFDINQGILWNEILDKLQIEKDKFPQILDCGEKVGEILPDIAVELNLSTSAIVSTSAMDQVASAIGAGNITSGRITETTGTALVIAATTDTPDYSNPSKVTIYRHAVKDKFIILPYCQTAGIILKWFKDEFLKYEAETSEKTGKSIYTLMDEMAERVPELSGGLFLLPHFAGMMAPDRIPNARGVFFGVGLDTKREHFIRAILESVAYMLKENIELLEKMGLDIENICSLGGGSKSKLWCKIKANVTGKEIITMEQEETTSIGAAILAGISAGMYRNIEDAYLVFKEKDIFKPEYEIAQKYIEGYKTYKKLYHDIKNCF